VQGTCLPSLRKSRGISRSSFTCWSILVGGFGWIWGMERGGRGCGGSMEEFASVVSGGGGFRGVKRTALYSAVIMGNYEVLSEELRYS